MAAGAPPWSWEYPEFLAALSLAAEARWFTQIVAELRSGKLTWSREELAFAEGE